MFNKLVDFFLFGSIFISLCAVALCIETSLLLNLPLKNPGFYFSVFGATLVQYNLHYFFKTSAIPNSRRLAWSLENKAAYKILITAGLVIMVYSLFSLPLRHYIIFSVMAILAFCYSFPLRPFTNKKIKDFGLPKIITLALVWTTVTVWLPADNINFTDLSFQLVLVMRFIFIFILCLLFDIRDTDIDRKENISTLPVKLGNKRSYQWCYLLLVIFILLAITQYACFVGMMQFLAMMISGLITVGIIEYSKKYNDDLVYLVCIDGMMLLQALLVIFAFLLR